MVFFTRFLNGLRSLGGLRLLGKARFVALVHRRPAQWLQVTAMTAMLVLALFGTFLTGRHCPPGDFLGAYNAEAYAWWRDGDFFTPPQWMPYLWGGYPAAASAQNSSWYLPVGLAAFVVPYGLWTASVLQVIHVVGGA